MKYLTYTLTLVLLFIMQPTHAHQWNADDWAKRQYANSQTILKCRKSMEKSYADYDHTQCDFIKMLNDMDKLFIELRTATEEHPGNQILEEFAMEDFTNVVLGQEAIQGIIDDVDFLMYIKTKLYYRPLE